MSGLFLRNRGQPTISRHYGPRPDAWRGHDELVVELCVLHFFSRSVPKVTRDCLCYKKDVRD